jgi:hypothetical protein
VPEPYEVHETTFTWRIEGCRGRQSIQGTFGRRSVGAVALYDLEWHRGPPGCRGERKTQTDPRSTAGSS